MVAMQGVTMARQTGIRAKINDWHQEFHSVKDAWVDWLKLNGSDYSNVEEAWGAFKTQLLGVNQKNQGSSLQENAESLPPRNKDYKARL